MSTEKTTEVKKEAIVSEVHSQSIENQGILEEAAHLGGRIAGAAKDTAVSTAVAAKDTAVATAVAAKDAVVHAGQYTAEKAKEAAVTVGEFTKEKTLAAGEFTKEKAIAAGEFTKEKAIAAGEFTKEKAIAAGEFTKEKAIAAKDYVVGNRSDTIQHEVGVDGQRDWFADTGVDRQEVMEERKVVLGSGIDSLEIDKRVGLDKVGIDKAAGVHDATMDKDKLGGGIHDDKLKAGKQKEGEFHDSVHNWFADSGVDKKEVMAERKEVLGAGTAAHLKELDQKSTDLAKGNFTELHKDGFTLHKEGTEKEKFDNTSKAGKQKEGEFHDSAHNWFADSGVAKKEVMAERKELLGACTAAHLKELDQKSSDLAKGNFTELHKDGFTLKKEGMEESRPVLGEKSVDNTSNTFADKAGQVKDQAAYKAGQMKDSALEKGGQMKDAAMEKGGQWKDAAADKAYQLKDSAMATGQQLKESAAVKGQQAKDSALETGEQLKGKALDAGQAVSDKGTALKAASEKGFVEQEARDKENVRY